MEKIEKGREKTSENQNDTLGKKETGFRKKSGKGFFILLLLIVGAAGVAGWDFYRMKEKVEPIVLYGNADIRQVNLSFRVGGRLETVLFDEGQEVKAGDKVASLEQTPFLNKLNQAKARLERAAGSFVFREPVHLVQMRRQQLDELDTRLGTAAERFYTQQRSRLERLESTLTALDPRRQLERGYAILFDDNAGKPVTSARNVPAGTRLTAQLADGNLRVVTE